MATKTKKIKSAGRFGAGYGKPKERLVAVETFQRVRQICPFCRGKAKRISNGIWHCSRCDKKFASNTYYLKN